MLSDREYIKEFFRKLNPGHPKGNQPKQNSFNKNPRRTPHNLRDSSFINQSESSLSQSQLETEQVTYHYQSGMNAFQRLESISNNYNLSHYKQRSNIKKMDVRSEGGCCNKGCQMF